MNEGLTPYHSRIRMCSTGPDTNPFARPAPTPAMNNCPPESILPPSPPRPLAKFAAANARLAYSNAPNCIETQTPIPNSGVRVPYNHVDKRKRNKWEVPLPCKMPEVPHSLRCHPRNGACPCRYPSGMFACADRAYIQLVVLREAHECALTTFTMSKGCPTMTCAPSRP